MTTKNNNTRMIEITIDKDDNLKGDVVFTQYLKSKKDGVVTKWVAKPHISTLKEFSKLVEHFDDLVTKPGYCIGFGNDEKYSVLGYDIEQEDWENPGNLTSSKPGWEDGECETTSYFDSKELAYG